MLIAPKLPGVARRLRGESGYAGFKQPTAGVDIGRGGLMKNGLGLRRGIVSLLAVVALFAVANAMPAAAQSLPAEPPLATSSNVHFVAHIPGSAAGMNFKDHYAYVSGWAGITVLDIAKADSPQLVGALPLPHFENEDVDLCGNTLLVVNDREAKDLGSVMYVISIANPTHAVVSAILPLGLTGSGRGSGHIANFVKPDCSQAWVDGGDHVEVVDLDRSRARRGRSASSSRPRR